MPHTSPSLAQRYTHFPQVKSLALTNVRSVPQGHLRNNVERCPAGPTDIKIGWFCDCPESLPPLPQPRYGGCLRGPRLKGNNRTQRKRCVEDVICTISLWTKQHTYKYAVSFCPIPAACACTHSVKAGRGPVNPKRL